MTYIKLYYLSRFRQILQNSLNCASQCRHLSPTYSVSNSRLFKAKKRNVLQQPSHSPDLNPIVLDEGKMHELKTGAI